MKKLVKVALVAGCLLLAGNLVKAQSKIGYCNFNALVQQAPEFKAVQTQIDAYQKTFLDRLQAMQSELQTKAEAYDKSKATMTDATRTATESELQDLNKRIQDYNNTASQSVQQKYGDLLKPLTDKLRAAVSQVAKEKGYTYVLDTSNTDLLVAPEGDDLLAAVKAKVGIAATAAPAPVKK